MIHDLMYDDDGKLSRSAFMGMAGFFIPLVSALVCTAYIVIKGAKFDGYDQFLSFCSTVMMSSAALLFGRAGINALAYKKEEPPCEPTSSTTDSNSGTNLRDGQKPITS